MALRIIRETDPIEVRQLTIAIYAPPGLGKTSLGFTAEKPLLLDFDGGAYRAKNRKDSVPVSSWADVDGITEQDLADYKTVIVDTAGRALDALTAHIIDDNPKLKGYGGTLSLQGYGVLKTAFVSWMKRIHGYGKDLILITHLDEQKKGDELIERLDVQGGSKGEIYKTADAMGRITLANKQRYLNFNPTDTAFGKNPAGLPPLEIPDFANVPDFMAQVIRSIKDKLNEMTEAQRQAAAEMADWNARFMEASTVDEFNALIPECEKASESVRDNVKRLLIKVAKDKGIEFDRKSKTFVAKEAA